MSTLFETVRISNLQDRKPFKVSVDGEDVLLAKIDEDIFAVSDSCTVHLSTCELELPLVHLPRQICQLTK